MWPIAVKLYRNSIEVLFKVTGSHVRRKSIKSLKLYKIEKLLRQTTYRELHSAY